VCLLIATPALATEVHPMSERYAQANPSAVTGRSGSAEVQARALLDATGTTVLELSTGDLESDEVPPGEIARLQIKVYDADGALLSTTNHNDLDQGGYVALTLQDLAVGQTLQLQASVRGIDGNRTSVVVVETDVHLLPDLAIAIEAPARALPGQPVTVTAVVQEQHGVVGATADCVLYADGLEVDAIEDIWVDGGDAVTCLFVTSFDAAGTYTLTAAVEAVDPGDWDASDNEASTTIEVGSDVIEMPYVIADASYRHNTVSMPGFLGMASTHFMNFMGGAEGCLDSPLELWVGESIDGVQVFETTHDVAYGAPEVLFEDPDLGALCQECGFSIDGTGQSMVCRYTYGEQGECASTMVFYNLFTGEAAYSSAWYNPDIIYYFAWPLGQLVTDGWVEVERDGNYDWPGTSFDLEVDVEVTDGASTVHGYAPMWLDEATWVTTELPNGAVGNAIRSASYVLMPPM